MDHKSYQPPAFFTTNTTSSRGAGTSRNAPPRNNSGPNYLRQLNKHSNNIFKPITKIFSNNIIPKSHAFDYKHMLTQLSPPVYKITKGEFKDFVQKVTGCTLKITAPPPPIKKPKPPSTRLQSIRPPPLMPICNFPPPPPLNTAFADPSNPMINFNRMNPINTINPINPNNTTNPINYFNPIYPMDPINPTNNVVAAPQPLPPLPPFPSVSVGVDSPITSYLRFVSDSVLCSPIPLLSPSILFSPHADQVGFPKLQSPGWNDVQV